MNNTASQPSDSNLPHDNETSSTTGQRPRPSSDRQTATSLPNGTDLFSQFMLTEISRRQDYLNLQANRSDQAVQLYLTLASATVGALAVILAASQPATLAVWLGIFAAAASIVGVVGLITAIRWSGFRTGRSDERVRLSRAQAYFEQFDPSAYAAHVFPAQPKPSAFWASPFVLFFAICHALLLAVGSFLGLMSLAYTISASPSSASLWAILLATLVIATISVFVTYRLYRRATRSTFGYR